MSDREIIILFVAFWLMLVYIGFCIFLLQLRIKRLEEIKNDTRVMFCLDDDCINNRFAIGEIGCNCKDIEISNGKCQQYIKRELSKCN